jgi:hypothetical protein
LPYSSTLLLKRIPKPRYKKSACILRGKEREGGPYGSYTSHKDESKESKRVEELRKSCKFSLASCRKEVGVKDTETAWVVHPAIKYKYRVTGLFCLLHLHAI